MRREQDESEALKNSDAEQSAWNQALVEIAGGFSHDANNCLTGIFSMSDLCLAQVSDDNPLQESLALIRESANQASQLLQRLSRLIYDQPGSSDYYNLNDVAAEVADVLRRVLPRNLELAVKLCDEPLPVYTDVVELRRSCLYLVLAAAGGIPAQGRILLETDRKSKPTGTVSLVVRPSGKGLAAKKLDGSGDTLALRLNLVRSFAEKYSGTLAATTPEEDTASLTLCLPRAVIG